MSILLTTANTLSISAVSSFVVLFFPVMCFMIGRQHNSLNLSSVHEIKNKRVVMEVVLVLLC